MTEEAPAVDGAPVDLLADLARVAGAATPEARARAAADLADRLVVRAETDDAESLTALLRGNPRREATVWRALQFRLGDVSPSTDAPHDNPCAAVLAVARPGDGSHVASELVAVDADGSAWTALVRTDDELVVHVPSPRSLVGPAAAPDAVGPLLLAWREALGTAPPSSGRHAAAAQPPAAESDSVAVEPLRAAAPPLPVPAAEPPPPAAEAGPRPSADGARTEGFDRLDAPGAPLDRLRVALQADLAARLAALEARLGLAAEEGARIAVSRALQDVHEELQALRDQLARLEKHLTG